MSKSGTDDNKRGGNSIVNQIPSFDEPKETDRILSRFVIEEPNVKKYEDAIVWREKIGSIPSILLVISYTLAIVLAAVFSNNSSVSQGLQSTITAVLLGIPLLIAVILWATKKIFDKIASDVTLIDVEAAVYHRISRAIQEYQHGNLDSSRAEFESACKMIELDDQEPFPPRISTKIIEFGNDLESDTSTNFYETNFPQIANELLYTLTSIKSFESKELYTTDPTIERASDNSPIGMITGYFSEWKSNRIIRIVAPYIVAAPFIYLIYQENPQLGQILLLIVVAVVQTYYRPSRDN